MLRDHRTRSNDGTRTDARVVEDNGTDADEHLVLYDAAVYGGVVAYGDQFADVDGVQVAHSVENRAVLNIGARADADGVDVAANDGVHPDAGVLP